MKRVGFFKKDNDSKSKGGRGFIKIIIVAASIVVLFSIAFVPFEKLFIRFDSVEHSLNYYDTASSLPYALLYKPKLAVKETDRAAFCMCARNRNFSYTTVTRYDDKYGFANADAQFISKGFAKPYTYIKKPYFINVTALKNRVSGETACYISVLAYEGGLDKIYVKDCYNKEAEVIYQDELYKVWMFIVDDNEAELCYYLNQQRYSVN